MRNVDPDSPLYKAAYNDDFPWIRDAAGNRVLGDDEGTEFLIDFTHPDAQDIIVQQALAVKECGLYDGIYIGWWHEDGLVLNRYRTFEEEQQARSVILERICDVVNDDFLIIVGSGQHKPMRAEPYINGLFMQIGGDHVSGYSYKKLREIETTLSWAEKKLLLPQVNCLKGWGVETQAPDSETNLRWMRALTTMGLTHSDGYVLHMTKDQGIYWYEFWGAPLGKPVGEKAQPYKNREGLFIREFTNGWAVYNRSGREQRIALPEGTTGFASGDTALSPLAGLINLQGLVVSETLVTDLEPLAGLTNLESIEASENEPTDLTPLSGLINLQRYRSWGTEILNLDALAELPNLSWIDICGGELSDISVLEGVTGLEELYLVSNTISDISPLANLKKLKHLNLDRNEVSNLSPLAGLKELTWINFRDNEISDVSPLGTLDNLTWLDLGENKVKDVSALTALRNLTWMRLGGNILTDASILERFSAKTCILYSGFVSLPMPLAGPKVEGPWLWAVVAGGCDGNTDLLEKASGGATTEVKVSTFGAKEGKAVGDKKWSEWTAHTLSPISTNNIDEMAADLNWDIRAAGYKHVVYGCVTLNAPRKQDTTIFRTSFLWRTFLMTLMKLLRHLLRLLLAM